jgi:hypothetical protein
MAITIAARKQEGAQTAMAASSAATSAAGMSTPRIGLAISGGGFRATCFGLGCLRALHDQDLLRHVGVISGISGGSVLTAFNAYGPAEFSEFDALVVDQLRRGLQLEIVTRALRPDAAVRNLAHATRAALMRRPASQWSAAPAGVTPYGTSWPLERSVTDCSIRSRTRGWRP